MRLDRLRRQRKLDDAPPPLPRAAPPPPSSPASAAPRGRRRRRRAAGSPRERQRSSTRSSTTRAPGRYVGRARFGDAAASSWARARAFYTSRRASRIACRYSSNDVRALERRRAPGRARLERAQLVGRRPAVLLVGRRHRAKRLQRRRVTAERRVCAATHARRRHPPLVGDGVGSEVEVHAAGRGYGGGGSAE